MLELVLLIFGVFTAVRRFGLRKLSTTSYPSVDPLLFESWKKSQLKANGAFLLGTWGFFVLKIALGVVLAEITVIRTEEAALGVALGVLAGWILALIIAWRLASRAKRIRRQAGIAWPTPGARRFYLAAALGVLGLLLGLAFLSWWLFRSQRPLLPPPVPLEPAPLGSPELGRSEAK